MPLLSRMGPPGTGHRLHTIAVIGALVGAVAILVFLILGSRVAPPRAPGVVHTTGDQDCAGDQRAPVAFRSHPRAKGARRQRARRTRQS
jgi:hypothetical protein